MDFKMPINTPKYSQLSTLHINKIPLGCFAIIFLTPLCSTALNCPTKLKKNADNTWHAPGFYPHFIYRSKNKHLKINGNDFSAALYNLKTKRLICTYRTNDRSIKWAPFITGPNGRIKPDLNAINSQTHQPLWQYNAKNNDYTCSESQKNACLT